VTDGDRRITYSALRWWWGKRPAKWDLETHLRAPWANCRSETERRLAVEVAAWVKLQQGLGRWQEIWDEWLRAWVEMHRNRSLNG
jgi:hypothetical protein